MQRIQVATDKVNQIISDFVKTMQGAGVGHDWIIQVSLAMLCRAKGNDVLPGINKALSYHDIKEDYLNDIVSQIQDVSGNNIGTILPAVAESLIDRFFYGPWGEVKQPKELTDLVLALVKESGCKTIYNPFAGLASYAFADFYGTYYSQEIDNTICNVSKMRLYLNGIDYSNCALGDSIKEWDDHNADCIVATPPFGIKIDPEIGRAANASSAEEFLLSKFISGNAKYAVFVVPRSVCFNNRGSIFSLRKSICEKHLLEMVINLPSGIFFSTGVSTSLVVLNKNRRKNDMICFVDAEKLAFQKRKKEKVLKTEEILHAISINDSNIIYRVATQQLYENDCSFDVARYASQVLSVSEGQEVISLRDIMSLDRGQRCDFHEELVKNVVEASNFVNNIVYLGDVQNEVMVNQPKHLFEGPHLVINLQGKVYVHKGSSQFYLGTALSQSVFKVNEKLVDIEYLAYKLLESGLFEKVIGGAYIPRVNASQLLTYKIVIDVDKEKQRRIVTKTKRSFLDSEKNRLGIREAGGDLTHMLGMPKDSIGNLIELLMLSETLSENDREWVKSINDNFRYMLRLINTVGVDFSSMSISSHEIHIVELVKEYAHTLKHLKFSNCFNLVEDFALSENVVIDCDEDMIRVILDTALRNAYSHGFEQKYFESNVVKIGCKAVEYDGKTYACITIANNGNPMTSGFSKEDFATRGKKAGKMGNTGKGGYHIYAIAKRYNGYINISSSKEWSFILDVLIPAHNIDSNEPIEEYGSKCI